MYSMDYIKLGNRIKEERNKRHVTRENMSEALDITASYLGHIERGERCVTLDTLTRIANYFELSLDYLLRDSLLVNEGETRDKWNQLIYGRTEKEIDALMDVIKTINGLL